MRHVFGPVPSHRLGRSLGIDVVPYKTCSYNCIYCQLGRTTCKTIERQERVGWELILDELRRSLDTRPDYITFSGSGEPTLYAGLGELIERIKSVTSVPIAVLTNGSLLWRPDVRQDLQQADLVIPSLDAGDELHFQGVNRPHRSLSLEQVVEGLIAFRREFSGKYWLEVLVVAPWTSGRAQVAFWRRLVSYLLQCGFCQYFWMALLLAAGLCRAGGISWDLLPTAFAYTGAAALVLAPASPPRDRAQQPTGGCANGGCGRR